MPMYMQIEGLEGDSVAPGYEKWLELTGLTWGASRSAPPIAGAPPTGCAYHQEASISDISITRNWDRFSTDFLQAAIGRGPTAKPLTVNIHLCHTPIGRLEPYIQMTLYDAVINGCSLASGGDRPAENVSLRFSKIAIRNLLNNPGANSIQGGDLFEHEVPAPTGP